MMSPKENRRLGQILVDRGALSARQLNEALTLQQQTKEFLGVLLMRQGWVREQQILEALAEQFHLSFNHLDPGQVDWELAEQFSASLLSEHTCLPISRDEGEVVVAIADPLDAWARSELEKQIKGQRLRLILAPRKEIRDALQELHRRTLRKIGDSLEENEG